MSRFYFVASPLLDAIFLRFSTYRAVFSVGPNVGGCIRVVLSGIGDVPCDGFFAPKIWREKLLYFSSGGVFAPNFWREKSFIRLGEWSAVVTFRFRCVGPLFCSLPFLDLQPGSVSLCCFVRVCAPSRSMVLHPSQIDGCTCSCPRYRLHSYSSVTVGFAFSGRVCV